MLGGFGPRTQKQLSVIFDIPGEATKLCDEIDEDVKRIELDTTPE
jgi:hypothetical protein